MLRIIKRIWKIINMAWANFDLWLHSPRTGIMMLFVASECVMLMRGLEGMMNTRYSGATMHLAEMLAYRMSQGCNLAIMSVLLLVTVNEIPRKIGFQNYSMIRATKSEWVAGQVLYCAMMVLFMIGMMVLFMLLCALPVATPGSGWSDLDRITNGVADWEDIIVNEYLLKNFTPVSALVIGLIPLFLFWFTMLLVILFSGLFGGSAFGIILYAFMMVAHIVFLLDGVCGVRFPSSYATLENICISNYGNELNALIMVSVTECAIQGILCLIMVARVKHMDCDFCPGNKY